MHNITKRRHAASRADFHRSNNASVSVPADFDPASCPIISRHFFGVEPFRPIGEVTAEIAAEVVSGLELPHRIEPAYRLGPRTCGSVLPLAGARAGP